MSRFNPRHPQSDVPGVSWQSRIGRWQVRLTVDGEYRSMGTYRSREEAEAVALRARDGAVPSPKPVGRPSVSGYPGVTLHASGRWHVRIRFEGRSCSFGLYDTVEEAAEVARQARAGEIEPSSNQSYRGRRTGRPRRRETPPPQPVTQHPLPYLHPPIVRRLVGIPDDTTPDPPIPARDPLRAKRINPLPEEELEYLRRIARGNRETAR